MNNLDKILMFLDIFFRSFLPFGVVKGHVLTRSIVVHDKYSHISVQGPDYYLIF